MALIPKTDPKGVDIPIDRIQRLLFNKLTAEGWDDYKSYHRVYKNPKDGGLVPEAYDGDKEYKEVLYNDGLNATSFFTADDNRVLDRASKEYSQTISAIFQVDLIKLFPAITHRADEEMHRLVFLALERNNWGYVIDNIVTGVNNVYSGFNTVQLNTDDMSECHVVRFDFNVTYNYKCKS